MSPVRCRVAGLAIVVVAVSNAHLPAQGTRGRPSTAIRSLESKAQEARQSYLTQLGDLAQGYEESGNPELAEETLRQILKINPEDDQVKSKIEELRNKVFEDNQRVIEVDASKGWIATGLKLTKGQPVRLMSEGSYKFIVNTDVGPEGFPTKDVLRDMGGGISCGALMGTIYAEATQRGRPPQPTEPFFIGRESEIKPEADGLLFVRLNVPPGSKCIGKVKVMVAGNISAAGGN